MKKTVLLWLFVLSNQNLWSNDLKTLSTSLQLLSLQIKNEIDFIKELQNAMGATSSEVQNELKKTSEKFQNPLTLLRNASKYKEWPTALETLANGLDEAIKKIDNEIKILDTNRDTHKKKIEKFRQTNLPEKQTQIDKLNKAIIEEEEIQNNKKVVKNSIPKELKEILNDLSKKIQDTPSTDPATFPFLKQEIVLIIAQIGTASQSKEAITKIFEKEKEEEKKATELKTDSLKQQFDQVAKDLGDALPSDKRKEFYTKLSDPKKITDLQKLVEYAEDEKKIINSLEKQRNDRGKRDGSQDMIIIMSNPTYKDWAIKFLPLEDAKKYKDWPSILENVLKTESVTNNSKLKDDIEKLKNKMAKAITNHTAPPLISPQLEQDILNTFLE